MENRNGLVVDSRLTFASGRTEREAAIATVDAFCGSTRVTLGADKGYAAAEFVKELRVRGITPHVA